MKKYKVTINVSYNMDVYVEADGYQDALDTAMDMYNDYGDEIEHPDPDAEAVFAEEVENAS